MRVTPLAGDVTLHDRRRLLRDLDAPGLDPGGADDLRIAAAAYARWGRECADRLLGDFAFAVADARDGRVFAARDPMGVRPLYYRITGETIAFATTAAGVAAVDGLPLELDPRRVVDVLVPALEAADPEASFYRGVFRLPAAHHLEFHRGRVALTRYWRPDTGTELRLDGDDAYVEAFREAFSAAVACRLDGGAAAMLSGGVDSSAIVGFARTPLTTLSGITADPGCEETRAVTSMLARPGLEPILIRPEDMNDYRVELERFLETMEAPFDAGMVLPLVLYAAASRRGFRAVLDGVDGDAVASLEPTYLQTLLAQRQWRISGAEAAGLARFHRGAEASRASALVWLASGMARAYAPAAAFAVSRRVRRRGRIEDALADALIDREVAREMEIPSRLEALWAARGPRTASMRERHAAEVGHPNIPAALERYHRVASSQGIEARHPFMDRRVVERALSFPWDQKVRGGWTKSIVRRACAGRVPDDVRWRRGRFVRLGPDFLASAIAVSGDFLNREMEAGFSCAAPYLDARKLSRALAGYRRGGDPAAAETIWQAAALNCWMRNSRGTRYDPAARANGPAAPPRLPGAGRRDIRLQEN